MENLPFFYYDIIARIIPGALMIAALRFAGARLPAEWTWMFQGGQAWENVVAGLICAGAAYVLGVIMEVIFATPLEWLTNTTFKRAFDSYVWRRDWFKPRLSSSNDCRNYRRHSWNWATLRGAHEPLAFAHAHRFQAETRLCAYSMLPALVFTIASVSGGRFCNFCSLPCIALPLGGIFFMGIMGWGAYSREKRRWIQVLVSADHFGFRWPAKPPNRRPQLFE
jgi:hypothetical protein